MATRAAFPGHAWFSRVISQWKLPARAVPFSPLIRRAVCSAILPKTSFLYITDICHIASCVFHFLRVVERPARIPQLPSSLRPEPSSNESPVISIASKGLCQVSFNFRHQGGGLQDPGPGAEAEDPVLDLSGPGHLKGQIQGPVFELFVRLAGVPAAL